MLHGVPVSQCWDNRKQEGLRWHGRRDPKVGTPSPHHKMWEMEGVRSGLAAPSGSRVACLGQKGPISLLRGIYQIRDP